jgi:hypothetical protein
MININQMKHFLKVPFVDKSGALFAMPAFDFHNSLKNSNTVVLEEICRRDSD